MTTELLPEAVQQWALWSELDRERRERVWKTVDRLNATPGRGTVRILSAGQRTPLGNFARSTGRHGGLRGGMSCHSSKYADLMKSA